MLHQQPRLEDIYAARQRIQPLVRNTTLEESPWLTYYPPAIPSFYFPFIFIA